MCGVRAALRSRFCWVLLCFFCLCQLSICFVHTQFGLKRASTEFVQYSTPTTVSADVFSMAETQYRKRNDDESQVDTTEDGSPAEVLAKSPIFDIVAANAAKCLFESDKRRDAKAEHSKLVSSSTTNWINDHTAFALQNSVDRIKLKFAEDRTGLDRDEASAWIRWMKSSPAPTIVDLSTELRAIANETISDENLELIETTRHQFFSRLGARLILLPSGMPLSRPLLEPPASLIYGKLIYGGVTRYRRLISSNSIRKPPRKAGERTLIKSTAADNIPAWIQYGGAERMYEGVDIGSAAVLEVVLLPRGQFLPELATYCRDMVIENLAWKPQKMFGTIIEDVNSINDSNKTSADLINFVSRYTPISQAGKDRNDAFKSDFTDAVGGLQPQIDAIVRRVLDGRVLRPAQEYGGVAGEDEMTTSLSKAAMEAEELAVLGLTPVRGLLLYGPPGTGKTLLARQIARALRAREPKILSAPELLDRWVGGSEKLVRSLFAEAEAELAACNGDPTKSALHVVVLDEIDAVFRRRSAGEDSGEQTRASVVNQILSKLDGLNAIDNVLMIGMTNRRELLDEALLRPGRLEVQIEVPLPDKEGRREILQIHFNALRKKGRLSKPLCCAIDGLSHSLADAHLSVEITSDEELAVFDLVKERKRDKFKLGISRLFSSVRPCYDLAAETKGFSGADIAGLVRSAGSLALSRARKDGSGVEGLLITLEDAKQALKEVKV
ncbi:ATPase AAA, CDC48 subfamily protein [Nitzschia inconspicua]|uniref:Vesicle-fusing ATPase n=1 Tax=Nitzschia inconspicua TaxID=303405 RepID=A0A9K3KR86_9STRA|nr:ATPase AAA, CDC48 subfamily protein [Nitzschia inconspicua]